MSRDLRFALEAAEYELRNAILAERAGIRGAEIRRARAEIAVENARKRCRRAAGKVSEDFGPEGV